MSRVSSAAEVGGATVFTVTTTSDFVATQRLMMKHETKPNPSPLPDVAITRAFERNAHPKIVRQLRDDDPRIRERANNALPEFASTPLHRSMLIEEDAVPALTDLLVDPRPHVRAQAARNLELLTATEAGAHEASAGHVQASAVSALLICRDDEDATVQLCALSALVAAARFDVVAQVVSDAHVLPTLLAEAASAATYKLDAKSAHTVNPTPTNAPTVTYFATKKGALQLALVWRVLTKRRADDALTQCLDQMDGVTATVACLQHADGKILAESRLFLEHACLVMAALGVRDDAKGKAVVKKAFPWLIRFMRGGADLAIQVAATTAAARIVTATGAKVPFAKAGGAQALVRGLTVDHVPLQLATLTCLTAAAEEPTVRESLQAVLGPQVAALRESTEHEYVEAAATECLRQLKFVTLPHPLKKGHAPLVQGETEVQKVLHDADQPLRDKGLEPIS